MNLTDLKNHADRLTRLIGNVEFCKEQISVAEKSEYFTIFTNETDRKSEIERLEGNLKRSEEILKSEIRIGVLLGEGVK